MQYDRWNSYDERNYSASEYMASKSTNCFEGS